MIRKLSFIVLATFTFSAFAESCANINLRSNQLLGTVRNQGSLGWCFAFTAADMYSVALNKRVSPFDIAVNYYRNLSRRENLGSERRLTRMSGGRQDWTLEAAKEFGLCPDNAFSGYQHESVPGIIMLDNLASELEPLSESERREVAAKKLYPLYQKIYRVFPMTPAPQLKEALIESEPGEYPLASLADKFCDGKRISAAKLRRHALIGHQGKDIVHSFINYHLARKRVVGIGYHTDSLKTAVGVSGMNHISSIIGSRNVNGKCEYLLRNSWGSFRDPIHKSLQKNFDGDYLWLPSELVRDMAREVHAIQKD